MANIIPLHEIKKAVSSIDLVHLMEEGFRRYGRGEAVIPPVGELNLSKPKGDVHIKYGYIRRQQYYVVKIASSFYENPKHGISSSNGLMLVFNQQNGLLENVLLDEGYLTDLRTAAAGALVAKYFAPKSITRVGIVGTGVQARMQLEQLNYYRLEAGRFENFVSYGLKSFTHELVT